MGLSVLFWVVLILPPAFVTTQADKRGNYIFRPSYRVMRGMLTKEQYPRICFESNLA